MTRSASASLLGPEFDEFLFAPIGEDGNEMPLSVLSALARLDVDPWEEAAKLARLPGETATQRLASLIAAIPEEQSTHLDSGMIAARLIALLPRQAGANIPPRETLLGVVVTVYVIFVAFFAGAQFIIASRQPPAQVDSADAPSPSILSTDGNSELRPVTIKWAGATRDTLTDGRISPDGRD